MIHSLLKYDAKEYGEHIAVCGKVLTQFDKFSLKLDEITCVKCKMGVVNNVIDSIDKRIELYSKYDSLEKYVSTLIAKKEYYKRMV